LLAIVILFWPLPSPLFVYVPCGCVSDTSVSSLAGNTFHHMRALPHSLMRHFMIHAVLPATSFFRLLVFLGSSMTCLFRPLNLLCLTLLHRPRVVSYWPGGLMLAFLFRYPALSCTTISGLCCLLWTGPQHSALHTLPSVPSKGLELTPAVCRCVRMRMGPPPVPPVPAGLLNIVPGGPCRAGGRCPFGAWTSSGSQRTAFVQRAGRPLGGALPTQRTPVL